MRMKISEHRSVYSAAMLFARINFKSVQDCLRFKERLEAMLSFGFPGDVPLPACYDLQPSDFGEL